MTWLLNAAYLLLALLSAPWWLRKKRADWKERFGHIAPLPPSKGRRLLIHAVSVGEVNLIRPLVDDLLSREIDLVIAVTTDTGIARARALYADRCPVVRYPLDASWAVTRFLDAVRPTAAALVELELWPNFISLCNKRGIEVAVINGRLSARSFRNYRKGRFFIGRCFRSLTFAAVQDHAYAHRFLEMGVAEERCHVLGTMKWDSANTGAVADVDVFANAMGIDPDRPLVVAGSTAPGEHELLRDCVPDDVQLLCAPRRPEWFDEAAAVFPDCARRTNRPDGANAEVPAGGRFILDTIGELRKAYALADIVVVGRSFGDLYGSDPMEPAALGKPVIIGPAVEDFRMTVDAMLEADAIIQCDRGSLRDHLGRMLASEDERRQLGARALRCVEDHQGASRLHAEKLVQLLDSSHHS